MTSATRRRSVADAIDALDNEIATLQDSKRDTFEDYRDKLAAEGMRDGEIKLEIKALKKAIARRRALLAKPAEVEEVDEKIDEITIDIMKNSVSGTNLATRAHVARSASREATPHNRETGEITETGEVRAVDGIANAETSSSEALCEHGAGAPMHPMDPAPQAIRQADDAGVRALGRLEQALDARIQDADNAAAIAAKLRPVAPYRVTDPAPAPAVPDPDLSPLIADAAARQEAARRLLGMGSAAE